MDGDLPAHLATRRVYRNPPIVEAIVELRFLGGVGWDLTLPGRFYDRIRDDFPGTPEHREVMEATFGETSSPSDAMFSINRKEQRVLFRNGNQLLQIGPRVLGVNSLRPYEGWESLSRRAHNALETYRAIAEPEAVRSIGVRYINRVELPAEPFRLDDYFMITQALPSTGFPEKLRSFFDRMELSYDDIPAAIALTWATAKSSKERIAAFLLDLDLRWLEPCTFEDVVNNIEELHNRERLAFESLIGDRLREMFDADNES